MKIYVVYDEEFGMKIFTNKHEARNLACALKCELIHLYGYSQKTAEESVSLYEFDIDVPKHILEDELNKKKEGKK